jgi:endonuclease/exonuclease/phosphatase family metal-dependent hydrolase
MGGYMNIRKVLCLFTFLILLFSACKDNDPVSPLSFESQEEELNKQLCDPGVLSVMTRNIYVGADVERILQAQDQNEIPLIVTEVFQTLLATNFPERAQALAAEILEKQPDLIGLQEVSLIRSQSPGDAVYGGTIPAENVVLDYLDILLTTLNGLSLDYRVVAKVQNADVEAPMVVSPVPDFDDVRLTDYDVILAKAGIKTSNPAAHNYKAKVSIPEFGVDLPRGYTAVTAEKNGSKYRFVNTHLEDADQGGELLIIQLKQTSELLLRLAKIRMPVILVGDFNSAATGEPSYRLLTLTNRYKDTWLINTLNDNPDGLTFGHDFNLQNPTQNFWKRIDYIFVRDGIGWRNNIKLISVTAEVLGDEAGDKTPSGLWPSDHGGVAADLTFSLRKNIFSWKN